MTYQCSVIRRGLMCCLIIQLVLTNEVCSHHGGSLMCSSAMVGGPPF